MSYIKLFDQITNEDIMQVGGKGRALGIMSREGLPIPPGFVITTDAYREFFNTSIPENIQEEIVHTFDMLGAELVAVRSSAVAEDSANTSWAGQLETYLNVSRDNLIESINKCWASIQTDRANAYAQKQGLSANQNIAVVVQKMIPSEVSGVLFTVNPVTKKSDEMMLEAVYGLGELLVQGMVTPYNYILDKKTGEVKMQTRGEQEPPENLHPAEILTQDEIKKLAALALQIENIYKKPQDIEWAKENQKFYILQSRPITTN